jgi:hypothetical protein
MVESFPHALAFWASTDPIGFIQAMCTVLIGPVSIAGSIWAWSIQRKGHSRA